MNSKINCGISLFITLLISVGCSNKLTNSDIKSRILEANSNVNTYSVYQQVSLNSIFFDKINFSERLTISEGLTREGDIDFTSKKAFLKTLQKFPLIDVRSGRHLEETIEEYIINNYGYQHSNIFNDWIEVRRGSESWTKLNQLSIIIDLIQDANIKIIKEEKIDLNEYYVLEITPNLDKLVEFIPKISEIKDYKNSIKSYTFIVWVKKDNFAIEKSKIDTKATVLDYEGKIEANVSIEIKISNQNKNFTIQLPAEAKKAILYGKDEFSPPKCYLSSGMSCLDFKVDNKGSSGQVTLVLMNGLGYDIESVVVKVENCGDTTASPIVMTNKEPKVFKVICNSTLSSTIFDEEFQVLWSNPATGVSLANRGKIKARIE